MASVVIYLDESGDLGWKFDRPYRRGGSSRYLTISAVVVSPENKSSVERVVRSLYTKYKWPTSKEMKWSNMQPLLRSGFSNAAKTMCLKQTDVELHALVVKKENVHAHIRLDANKLYNYMIKLLLIDLMAQYDVVTLIPDPRSVKVQSGNSLHDYLQTELWFTKKAITKLITAPQDSSTCLGLQFSDMIAGIIQGRHEDNENTVHQIISPHVKTKTLYF
jgi:Protein of unknown function (DUF3800)